MPLEATHVRFALGVDNELGIKIRNKAEEFLKDAELVKKIENIYIDMLENYNSIIKD